MNRCGMPRGFKLLYELSGARLARELTPAVRMQIILGSPAQGVRGIGHP